MTNEELTQKFVELDERVSRHTEQLKTAFNQISDVKSIAESVHKLATTVEILTIGQKSTTEKLDKISNEIEEIKDKPAKRWDSATTVVITAILTAVVTFLLTQIGLK